MFAGRVHKKFLASNGKQVVLRAARWEDLDALTKFAKEIVAEQRKDPGFGTLIKGPVSRKQEARWLADKLVAIELRDEVSVVAEVDGKLVANSEVTRGRLPETSQNGVLGISVSRGYRGIGIGGEMLACLIDLSRKVGMKTLELGVLSTNPKARKLYSRAGFKEAGQLEGKVRRDGRVIDVVLMTMEL